MAVSARTRVELYFTSRFGGPPSGVVFRPGRLVLLGEHVDHQGGRVLAVPQTRGVYVAWGLRPDRRIDLHALNARGTDRFELENIVRSGRRWADLARGVAAALGAEGRRLPGVNLAVFGDLPAQRGLGSSAAYTTAILEALLAPAEEAPVPAAASRLVAGVERDWARVACGLMDPYVSLVGQPGDVVCFDTRALSHEILRLPAGARLEDADTGIHRRLSETPYNARRQELERARSELRTFVAGLESVVDLSVEQFAEYADALTEPGRRRARHVVSEAERVRQGIEALEAADVERLGHLMHACHVSLRDDFECSLPEIDGQVERLEREPGVLGVRLQGAGWGGSLAVLRRDAQSPQSGSSPRGVESTA